MKASFTHFLRNPFLFVALLFSLGSTSIAHAIDVDVVFDNSELLPNNYVFAKIIVSNRDGVTRENVTLSATVPTSSRVFFSNILPAPLNCSSSCSAGQVTNWALGDIGNGETRVIHYPVFVNSGTANGTSIDLSVSASHDTAGSPVTDSASATARTSPEAVISITALAQVTKANSNIDYEISFANIDNSGITGTSLRATIPSGTTFVSATDGGTVSGGEVVWDTGTFNAGDSQKRGFTVQTAANASNATIYESVARFIDNGSDIAVGSELVAVYNPATLTLDVAITGDVRTPGQLAYLRYTIANNGNSDLTGVTFNVMSADNTYFNESYTQLPVICPSSTCDVGEWGVVNIGQLDAGESRVVLTALIGNSPIDGVPWVNQARVTSDNSAFTLGTKPTVLYSSDQSLRMSISANKQLVSTAEEVTYEVSFGNVDTSAFQNLVLEAKLPPSTLFVNASDSGVRSGDTITWQLGTLNAGEGGKRYFTVRTGAVLSEGLVLNNQAKLHAGEESLSRATESVVIKNEIPLTLNVAVTGDLNTPSNRTFYRYVVSNTSELDITDVRLSIMASAYTYVSESASNVSLICPSSTCDSGEIGYVDFGTLEPGESKVVLTPLIRNGVLNGTPLVSHALVTEGSGAFTLGTKPTVLSSSESSLSLSVAADRQIASSNSEIEYELSFGNFDDSAYQTLELEFDLPNDTTFVSTSDGGLLNNGVVTWQLDTLNSGKSGKRYVVVRSTAGLADGLVLESQSRLHQGGASLTRAGELVVIRGQQALTLDVSLTGDARSPNMYSYYRYVVANTSDVDVTDIQFQFFAARGSYVNEAYTMPTIICPSSTCDDNEVGSFTIDSLEPGESQVIFMPVTSTSPVDGLPWIAHAFVSDSANEYTLGVKPTVLYDDDKGLLVNIAASKQVVKSSEQIQYEVSFGNVGTSAVQDLNVKVELPDGASFVSASGNGTESQGQVTWDIGTLNSGESDKQFISVILPAAQSDGDVLHSRVMLDTGGESLARATENIVIKSDISLDFDVAISTETKPSWGYSQLQYVMTNTGNVDVTDVRLYLMTGVGLEFNESLTRPQFICPSSTCDAGELGYVDIGQIEAGETVAISVPTYTRAAADDGKLLYVHSFVTASSTGAILGNKATLLYQERGERTAEVAIEVDKVNPQVGSLQEVNIKVGNPTSNIIRNALLTLEIPEGYTIVSRTGRAILLNGNLVWPQGDIPIGRWLQESVTLRVNSAVSAYDLIKLSAQLNDNSDANVIDRTSFVSIVSAGSDLDLSFSDSFTSPLGYGDTVAWNLRVTNNDSVQLADVGLSVNVPVGTNASSVDSATGCSGNCDWGEWAFWDLNNIDSSSEVNRTIMPFIINSTSSGAPPGNILLGVAKLTHSSSPVRVQLMNKTWGVGQEYSVATNFDSDGDQIPDWWELAFGLNRLSASDANADADGDGDSNLVEYQQGRNPNKPDGDLDTDGDGVIDRFDSAPRDPNVAGQSVLSFDGDSSQDLYVVGEFGSAKQIRSYDATSGTNTASFNLPNWFVHDFTLPVGDADGDGIWDLMVFGETPRGAKVRYLQSGAYTTELKQLSYPGYLTPAAHKDATRIADVNGNKRDEIAVLIENGGGRDAFMVYDSAVTYDKAQGVKTYPNTLIKAVLLPGWFEGETIVSVSDWNGNGASELIIFGRTPSNTAVWLKYDSVTGASLGQGTYPGWFNAEKFYIGPDINANGTESVVTLGTTSGGAKVWLAQDARSGGQVRSGGYPGWLTPSSIALVPDENGDGLADLITLATTSGGNLLWRRNSISNNGVMRQKSYPGWFTPESMEIVVDLNSNNEPELATFGVSSSGRNLWLVDDASTGVRSSSPINLPVDFSQ